MRSNLWVWENPKQDTEKNSNEVGGGVYPKTPGYRENL